MRSMSFSEFEMMSQPLILLTVISTTEIDPVAAMVELASVHHTPACYSNGQYEPVIQRVYLLLDDAGEKVKEPFSVLRLLHSRFPPSCTKLIAINSFTATAPNFQQPDMWSKFLIPKYFPEQTPQLDLSKMPLDPLRNQIVLGCRLSVDDFMKLREFCIWLYNEQIVPALEKRLTILGKQVNDSRRGVKNVFKSFWRKPREESEFVKGSIKYRYDKIEAQTLLLADTAFMVRDYETAAANYKLVRDEYKSDKSTLHLAYSFLMIAACQIITEPHKYRDTHTYLDGLSQCLVPNLDLLHANASLAMLAAEMYVTGNYGRAPLESARVLLQAAQNVNKYPLLSGLLIERSASFMLQGFQVRRYVFHSILAGNKLHRCGELPAKHAMTLFAAASMILEKGNWGDMKTKLARALSSDMKALGPEARQRSLMLLLKILASIVNDSKDTTNQNGMMDAVAVLNEISKDGGWGSVRVNEGWAMCPTRDVLLGPLPIGDLGDATNSTRTEICGLAVPELDMESLLVLEPVNGSDQDMLQRVNPEMLREVGLIQDLLTAEREICCTGLVTDHQERVLAKQLAKIQRDFRTHGHGKQPHGGRNHRQHRVRIPLGEKLFFKMKIRNQLPVDLRLTNLRLGIDRPELFDIPGCNTTLMAEQTCQTLLEAKPSELGNFKIVNAQWQLSETLAIKQTLSTKGALLQRTLKQRANRERAEDNRLSFEVVPAEPLLRLSFEGLSPEALQGQLLRCKLRLINEGSAIARDIFLKCSHPWFLFFDDNGTPQKNPLPFFGCSSTVLRLGELAIEPRKEHVLDVWLRISAAGPQRLSLLASYAENEDCKSRTSYLTFHIHSLPCAKLSVQLVPKLSSSVQYTMVAEITNLFKVSPSETGLPRDSSLGPLDRPDISGWHAELDEQGVEVVGLRLLGGAHSQRTNAALTLEGNELRYLTSPGERVVECYPLHFNNPHQVRRGNNIWLLPLADVEQQAFAEIAGRGVVLPDIIERFQCLWYAVDGFAELVAEAKLTLELEEVEADVMGPRSIADVRRARQQKNQDNQEEEDSDTEVAEVSLAEEDSSKGSGTVRQTISSVQDVADMEVARNALSVGVVWVCRWRNKLRWGLHQMPHVGYASAQFHARSQFNYHNSLISQKLAASAPSPSVAVAAAETKALALQTTSTSTFAALQFAVSHKPRAALSNVGVADVSVHVTVRSFVDEAVTLQLRVKHTGDIPTRGPTGNLSKTAFRGLAWINQTGYSDIKLSAHAEVTLSFCAQVMSVGTHNLNR